MSATAISLPRVTPLHATSCLFLTVNGPARTCLEPPRPVRSGHSLGRLTTLALPIRLDPNEIRLDHPGCRDHGSAISSALLTKRARSVHISRSPGETCTFQNVHQASRSVNRWSTSKCSALRGLVDPKSSREFNERLLETFRLLRSPEHKQSVPQCSSKATFLVFSGSP